MRKAITLMAIIALAPGCENILSGSGLSESEIDNIEPGDANGVVFSGTWKLKTTVTESSCGGFVGLPAKGDDDEEDVTFVQSGGTLTRLVDDLGFYVFKGSVNQDGTFTYGQYYDLSEGLPVSAKYLELVQGQVALNSGGGKATLDGTATRRYQSSLFDCSAELSLTGERTNFTGDE